jgi:hypothetical protein
LTERIKVHSHSPASGLDSDRCVVDTVQQNNIRVLNVAGPRASKEPKVAEFVTTTLDAALKP